MSLPPLHDDVAHLAFLLGVWRGHGAGSYPTIESFEYLEEVTIGHVGKPFLSYAQKTRDAGTNLPLHAETGFIRPVGTDGLEFILTQPSGIVEMHEGVLAGSVVDGVASYSIALATTSVQVTATARPVDHVTRSLTIEGPSMSYDLDMAAVGQPLQHHLKASLQRDDS